MEKNKDNIWGTIACIFFLVVIFFALWMNSPIIAIIVAVLTIIIVFWFLKQPKIKYEREAIPDYVKEQVLKIQNNKCSYCGNQFDSPYEIDWHHIKPVAQGGRSDDVYNISALHSGCHATLTRNRRYQNVT